MGADVSTVSGDVSVSLGLWFSTVCESVSAGGVSASLCTTEPTDDTILGLAGLFFFIAGCLSFIALLAGAFVSCDVRALPAPPPTRCCGNFATTTTTLALALTVAVATAIGTGMGWSGAGSLEVVFSVASINLTAGLGPTLAVVAVAVAVVLAIVSVALRCTGVLVVAGKVQPQESALSPMPAYMPSAIAYPQAQMVQMIAPQVVMMQPQPQMQPQTQAQIQPQPQFMPYMVQQWGGHPSPPPLPAGWLECTDGAKRWFVGPGGVTQWERPGW